MSKYSEQHGRLEIIVHFATEQDRKEFCRRLDLDARVIPTLGGGRNIWWPPKANDTTQSLFFMESKDGNYD